MKKFRLGCICAAVVMAVAGCGELATEGANGTGCVISKEEYAKLKIFYELAQELTKNQYQLPDLPDVSNLPDRPETPDAPTTEEESPTPDQPNNPAAPTPARVSLRKYCPPVRDQGEQSSCVGWSSAYAARTILEANTRGADPRQLNFSPAFVYNQIKQGDCTVGSFISDALKVMHRQGVAPLTEFPYSADECNRIPAGRQLSAASAYRISDASRLTEAGGFGLNIRSLKQHLAQKMPVVVAMPVGGSFYEHQGKALWRPTPQDRKRLQRFLAGDVEGSGLGGHAMCVIGFDDQQGTIEIMNSWGPNWGDKGFFEMRQQDFADWCMEAYSLYAGDAGGEVETAREGSTAGSAQPTLWTKLGFYQPDKKTYLNVTPTGPNVGTAQGKPGLKFKLEIENKVSFYAYIIGQETDGGSYVLFPPPPVRVKDTVHQYSTYFGLKGGRLFPEAHTLFLDAKGQEDVFAVLLSKQALNIDSLNQAINTRQEPAYEARIRAALGNTAAAEGATKLSTDGPMLRVEAPRAANAVVPVVLKIKKR